MPNGNCGKLLWYGRQKRKFAYVDDRMSTGGHS